MADNFNMKKFLAENKLGAYSKLRETEKEEEGYMGTQYDSSEDMAVDMVKKGITEKDKLDEYEVIYRIEDGRCYRITDEGYKDEVNMSYCRMYAESKEKEEAFGGINENVVNDPRVEEIIQMLKDLDVDGETMEYIIRQVGMDDQMANQLVHNKAELNKEAFGGKNPEGDKLVLRFLQGVAKKFDYPVAKAAMFVKDTIKSLGY